MKLTHLLVILTTQTLIQTIYSGAVFGKNELPCGTAFRKPSVPRLNDGRRAQSIVGGVESQKGSWPWMVKITIVSKKFVPKYEEIPDGEKIWADILSICSGTIVDKDWILSAAHCFEGVENDKIAIYAGDVLPSKRYGVHRSIVERKPHDLYRKGERGYDAVLLKVDKSFTFSRSSNINKVCMPDVDDQIDESSECYTMGWGLSSSCDEPETRTLKEININYYDINKYLADKRVKNTIKRFLISQPVICLDSRVSSYPSLGDSGSPFLCVKEDIYTTYGVLSGGWSGPKQESITVFSNVTNIVSWIKVVINPK